MSGKTIKNMKTTKTDRKYPHFHAICRQHGINYKDMVLNYTDGRTDSLRALDDDEYSLLFDQLKKANRSSKFRPKPGDQQRKKLISIAKRMNWGLDRSKPWIYDIDLLLERLDQWCLDQTFKKPMMGHSPQELNLLVSIFEEKVLVHYYSSLNKTPLNR